jgi:transcriptional regulator with XRE-family HTH domain
MAKHRPLEDDVEIGRRIRLQRINKGMSQTELGNSVGVTFQQIQKYENGKNRVGGSRMKQIADALSVTPAHFFGVDRETKRDAAATSETVALMNKPGALKLLRSYAKMTPAGRDAINRVAAMMVGDKEE